MDLTTLVLTILPLVAFVVVDLKFGPKAGIATAVGFAVFLLFWVYFKTGTIDELILVEVGLLVVLGIISIWLKNSRFFKFQPTIMDVLLAAYVAYFQFFSEPILVHMKPMMVALNPMFEQLYADENTVRFFAMLSGQLIWVLLAHAVIVGYAALKLSNIAWITTRILIYPMLLLLVVLARLAYTPIS